VVKRKKMRALVLSGGAAKGAFQIGCLKKWMYEDGLDYEILCGVSVGAINTAYLSQTKYGKPKAAFASLLDLWHKVNDTNVKKPWFPFGILEALFKPSVYNSEPLQDWITNGLNIDAILNSGRKLRIGAVAWDTAEYKFAKEDDPELVKWVVASSSFPVMLLPIDIGGRMWSDGGLRSVTPLGEAIRLGADEIDVIMCSNPDLISPWDTNKKHTLDYFMRAIDIMGDEIVRADLKICGLKNDLAELRPEFKKVKIRLLQPKQGLIDNSLNFNQKEILRMIEIGYQTACELGDKTL
jgi:predicted acylesterase/phospholipase RssA